MSEQRFQQQFFSEPLQQAAMLQLAIGQISELPAEVANLQGGPLRVAAIESFMVNIRLIGDFLLKNNRRDVRPEDFGVIWSRQGLVPDGTKAEPGRVALGSRLGSYWNDASGYVVHLSKRRYEGFAGQPIDETLMATIATDALTALAPFIRSVVDNAPEDAPYAELPADDDDDGWNQQALVDRARLLRDEFLKACARLDIDGANLLASSAESTH